MRLSDYLVILIYKYIYIFFFQLLTEENLKNFDKNIIFLIFYKLDKPNFLEKNFHKNSLTHIKEI